ncbi:MAG: hypothetical protein JO320_12185 [Alphaproteobacteria bacterium]|nr:hypothetical protein [Alphaproteobacteria bacterium]MBV9375793.1 hypothetical protein [Alphaproteobacteria bacterium]
MITLDASARVRKARIARLVWNVHDEKIGPGAEHAAGTPYRLLWSIGVGAFVLCAAAFALWGIYGANTLFDLIAALCL